jgi:hypothetical protein
MSLLTGPSSAAAPTYGYNDDNAAPVRWTVPVYVAAPAGAPRTALEGNRRIIHQGLLGAAVGAVAAEASGGKAGTGALVGAGTHVIGGALADVLLFNQAAPAQPAYFSPQPAYPPYYHAAPADGGTPLRRHVIRKYDAGGKLISEEEVWK